MSHQRCQALTQNGTPCNAYAREGSDYCFHHDPACALERREARSKGGRARHGRHVGPVGQTQAVTLYTVDDVVALLQRTLTDTLQLENSIRRSRTVGYLCGVALKALELSQLDRRLQELERLLNLRE